VEQLSYMLKDMFSSIIWYVKKILKLIPTEGPNQIIKRGHRAYVGSKWDIVGKLQIEYLKFKGLRQWHTLFDIGCGSLRAGVHFIKYLDERNYIGIEKQKLLVDLALKEELEKSIQDEKKPIFLFNDNFEFEKIDKKFDYAIAQSVFTHMTLKDIEKCLLKLHAKSKLTSVFYATFDEINITKMSKERKNLKNPPFSHSNISFFYERDELKFIAEKTGWKFNYIGDWGHPSKQMMIELKPKN